MDLQQLIGVDPTQTYNPFAHVGTPAGNPEARTIGTFSVELQPRAFPMQATITDEEGKVTVTHGFTALLAYCARWNPGTQLLRIIMQNGHLAPRQDVFEAYRRHCLRGYKSLNADRYEDYEDAGMQDKVRELDEAFKQQHTDDETRFMQEAANLDEHLFHGRLAHLIQEYLRWTPGARRAKAPDNTALLKGKRVKINICVKNRWLVDIGDGTYTRAQGTTMAQLAFILGVLFAGDKITNGAIVLGKSRLKASALQEVFHCKSLSSTRAKLINQRAEDFSKFYNALR